MARIAENTVIVDGQEYKPGDVIPDFKSIKCVDTREPRKYQGLSADVSVLNDVIAKYASGGASCFMSDTGEYYEYDRKEKAWKLITNITERGFDSEKAYGALKHMLKNVTVSDEKIQSAVTNYLTVNPVLPGATTEQAQQIEQNKTDVASLKEETGSLKEDLSNKITKFYASNEGKNHLADSDNGKIEDMVLYGKSEQKQYKGINLFPPDTNFKEYVEVSIPKGSLVFWITDGILTNGGNFKFFNEDKTESMWFGIDSDTTSNKMSLTIDAKYVQNLIDTDFDLSKICLGVGSKPIYEPYTGGIPSPSPDYPQEIKSVVNPTVKVSNEDGTKSQTVTLPYTLNAIPVLSDGNVTIDGQQYIADYVDVERGKVVKMVDNIEITGDENWALGFDTWKTYPHCTRCDNINHNIKTGNCLCEKYSAYGKHSNDDTNSVSALYARNISISDDRFSTVEEFKAEFERLYNAGTPIVVYYIMNTPKEIDLTEEEIAAFKSLATYYPATNLSVNSEQLDGYTVFNYPISMKNGWDYVKKQLNDNRDYIYDMDIQSAEAYVNSEYAVALTELEV